MDGVNKVKGALSSLGDTLLTNSRRLGNWISTISGRAKQALMEFATNVRTGARAALVSFSNYIKTTVIPTIASFATRIYTSVIGAVTTFATTLTTTEIPAAISFATTLATNPLTWIAVAGIAIYELVKHWDQVKEAFSKCWDFIKSGVVKLGEWMEKYTPLGMLADKLNLGERISSAFEKVKGIVQDFGKWISDHNPFSAIGGFVDKLTGGDKKDNKGGKTTADVAKNGGKTTSPAQNKAQTKAFSNAVEKVQAQITTFMSPSTPVSERPSKADALAKSVTTVAAMPIENQSKAMTTAKTLLAKDVTALKTMSTLQPSNRSQIVAKGAQLNNLNTNIDKIFSANKFSTGTIVPGAGGGDKVAALLQPGEAVVPREIVKGGTSAIAKWFNSMGVSNKQIPKGKQTFMDQVQSTSRKTASSTLSKIASMGLQDAVNRATGKPAPKQSFTERATGVATKNVTSAANFLANGGVKNLLGGTGLSLTAPRIDTSKLVKEAMSKEAPSPLKSIAPQVPNNPPIPADDPRGRAPESITKTSNPPAETV
jgi:hypothetical protein